MDSVTIVILIIIALISFCTKGSDQHIERHIEMIHNQQRLAEEQRLALWRLRNKNDTLRDLQRVRALRCVQNHPHILQQTIAMQTVAKPLRIDPVEHDTPETTLERLIRTGIAVPAHGTR
jgi:hypothetical protein